MAPSSASTAAGDIIEQGADKARGKGTSWLLVMLWMGSDVEWMRLGMRITDAWYCTAVACPADVWAGVCGYVFGGTATGATLGHLNRAATSLQACNKWL